MEAITNLVGLDEIKYNKIELLDKTAVTLHLSTASNGNSIGQTTTIVGG